MINLEVEERVGFYRYMVSGCKEALQRTYRPVQATMASRASRITNQRRTYDINNRAFDVSTAAILMLFLSPLYALIALIILLTSGRPVVFAQKRLTKGGRIFTMYKFRTMKLDAERVSGPVWATKDDPRISALGSFLRALRLDELPQLYNVVKGEMKLIGPRPERPEIAAWLTEHLPEFSRRLEVEAGITGLAQVRVGYPQSLREYRNKLRMDLFYIKERSIRLDLRIYLETVQTIFCLFQYRCRK